MAGTNLYAWGRGGAGAGAQIGTPATATVAAFSPNATVSTSTGVNPFHPQHPFGLAFWTGVGAIVLLAFIRHSLPA
jgi:hypothetical protein